MDAAGAVERMAKSFKRRDAKSWTAAYSAWQLLLDDREYDDHNLLVAVHRRITTRLATRIMGAVLLGAVDEEDVVDELIDTHAEIIKTIGSRLARFRPKSKHRAPAIGGTPWSSRHPLPGPTDDEGAIYRNADLDPIERAAIEEFYRKRHPPFAAIGTIACIASDVYSRNGCTTESQMARCVQFAEVALQSFQKQLKSSSTEEH